MEDYMNAKNVYYSKLKALYNNVQKCYDDELAKRMQSDLQGMTKEEAVAFLAEEYKKQEEEKIAIKRMQDIHFKLITARVGKRYINASLKNFINNSISLSESHSLEQEEINATLKKELYGFFDNYFMQNLFIKGGPGTGKTYLGSALIREVIERKMSALYITAADFQLWYAARDKTLQMIERMKAVDFLVIDDLQETKLANNNIGFILDNVLGSRYANELPTALIADIDDLSKILNNKTLLQVSENLLSVTLNGTSIQRTH